ncbi:hypothetical protein ACR3K2_18590 [Cryptosporidium serpentis]
MENRKFCTEIVSHSTANDYTPDCESLNNMRPTNYLKEEVDKYGKSKIKYNKYYVHITLIIVVIINIILMGLVVFTIISFGSTNLTSYTGNSLQAKNRANNNGRLRYYPDSMSNIPMNIKKSPSILPLHLLYSAPLESIENVDAIVLEILDKNNSLNNSKKVQYLFHIESASREVPLEEYGSNINSSSPINLKLNLTGGKSLILGKDKALLYEKSGALLHTITFPIENYDILSENNELNNKDKRDNNKGIQVRQLISSNSHKSSSYHSLKTQSAYMAAVCKYGCGEMGVTYPYYYRPFFGYGFPLLGTEPYFHSGYGGNVDTAMSNNMFNPEATHPRPPGLQATPEYSPFTIVDNPYSYPYSVAPGGGYYYYYPAPRNEMEELELQE